MGHAHDILGYVSATRQGSFAVAAGPSGDVAGAFINDWTGWHAHVFVGMSDTCRAEPQIGAEPRMGHS